MKRKGPRRDAEKERFWQGAVRRQRQSGQSIRDYCRENALSEPSFYAWRRELRRRGIRPANRRRRRPGLSRGGRRGAVAFVPLRVAAEIGPACGMAAVELALPSGAVLRWPAGVEPAAAAALVSAWERSRC
jgi:hypothetical protein